MEKIHSNGYGEDDSFGWAKFQDEISQQEKSSEIDSRCKCIAEMLNDAFDYNAYKNLLKDCDEKQTSELVGYTMTYAQILWGDSAILSCPEDERNDLVYEMISLVEKLKEENDDTERKKLFCRGIITSIRERNPDSYELLDPFDTHYDQADDLVFEDGAIIYDKVTSSLIRDGYVYHGFNSGVESSIREKGLSADELSTTKDEIERIDSIAAKYNPERHLAFGYLSNASRKWGDYSGNAVFYTTNPAIAYEYATEGPEWLSYFVDGHRKVKEEEGPYVLRNYEDSRRVMENWCDNMMGLNIKENTPPRATWMNHQERSEVMSFFEKQWSVFGNGEPRVALFSRKSIGRDDTPEYLSYEKMSNKSLSEKIASLIDFVNMGVDYKTTSSIPPEAIQIIDLPIYQKAELFKKKTEYEAILENDYGYSGHGEDSAKDETIRLAESDAVFRKLLSPGELRYFSQSKDDRKMITENYEDGYYWNANYTSIADSEDKPGTFREFINRYYDYLDKLDSIEMPTANEKLKSALATSLVYSDYPQKRIKQLLTILSRKDIPVVAKEFVSFETISPIEATRGANGRDTGSVYFNAKSPILCSAIYESDCSVKESAYNPNAEHRQIIFSDLLKCALKSDGSEMKQFILGLKADERLINDVVESNGDLSKFNDEQIESVARLISQCDALYHQMQIGQDKPWDLSDDLHQAACQTIERFKPTERYSLADRIVRCFCYPLGIKNADDALSYIENNQKWANMINGSASIWGEYKNGERVFDLHKGDLVKSINNTTEALAGILKNGVLAYNYVGDGSGLLHRDFSQMDTDFAMISDQQGTFFEKVKQSSAGDFLNKPGSEIVLMIHPHESMFQRTEAIKREQQRDQYGSSFYEFANYADIKADPKKYELYKVGAMTEHDDDYGIRTGLPSSEISCIMVGEDVAKEVIRLVRNNSFYIPVVDKTGELLLTFEDYNKAIQ